MKNKPSNEEVYSTGSFEDISSSPFLYSIMTITFFLGVAAIFGFLDQPQKFKAVVDTVTEDVTKIERTHQKMHLAKQDRYSVFTKEIFNKALTIAAISPEEQRRLTIKNTSFNYDITSNEFWDKLDATRLESIEEEITRESANNYGFDGIGSTGAPLSPDYHKLEGGDSKYTLKAAGVLRL